MATSDLPGPSEGIQRNEICSLRATGISGSDDRARSSVPRSGSDYSDPFRGPGTTVVVLFLTALFLLCLPL